MTCYLIRHGKDDETVRGGWSQQPLTEEGIRQAEALAERIFCQKTSCAIKKVYSSDLQRAQQTAQILADRLNLTVMSLSQFREVNNGVLAGMDNKLALERYPGLFWNQLGWEQCYPGGESPGQFYERVCNAWEDLSGKILSEKQNVALITHGGVIQVILSIIRREQYSNASGQKSIPYAALVKLVYVDSRWEIAEMEEES